MPEVWKDVFRTGTYLDHTGEAHTFTSQDVLSALRNGRAMLRHRIPYTAPGIYEHDWSGVPERLSSFMSRIGADRDRRADEAKNTFGWAKDYRVRYELDPKSGKSRPVLDALLAVPDERDLKQLAKTRFVSPRVDWGFRDSLGRTWDGCAITHIAATHSPIQIDQRPLMLGRPASLKTLFLGAPMAGEKDDKGPPKKDGEPGDGTDMATRLKAICAAMDWPVPDSANAPEEVLLIMESHAQKGPNTAGNANDNEPDDPFGTDDNDPTTAGSSVTPAMLSAMAPEVRAVVEAQISKGRVVDSHHRGALAKRFRAVESDAAKLHIFGKDTVQRLRKMGDRLKSVNLSFTPEGELIENGLIRELETLEVAVAAKLGAGNAKPSKKVRVVQLSGMNADAGPGGEPTPPAPQKPGDPGWDEAIKKITEDRVARALGK